ncbi:MAG: tyrosine-protein phosphatase, partial [Firmicutes bacterium]|nr:tyrosine-protein phosphatase [Bacillota bacterium]
MKRVALEGAHNFRDLGGIPAGPAKSTRWGCLYRSDSLAGLSASDWEELAERNIR